MRDYDVNVSIVLDTLTKFMYKDTELKTHEQYYENLRVFLKGLMSPLFSLEPAITWCESSFPVPLDMKKALLAVNRLGDIYQHGHILGSHLKYPYYPTEYYSSLINEYLASLNENRTETTLYGIRYHCLHFCCYIQYNGICKLEDVDYQILEKYVGFLSEVTSGHSLHNKEGAVSAFLMYWSQKGICRIGHSLYMSYAKTDRIITMRDLSEETRKAMEGRREESQLFPPEEFYATIPDFVERLSNAGYSETKTSDALRFLKCFFLFIDIENLGYDRLLVDAWVKDVAPSLFGALSGLKHARRLFEMFEDYVTEGDLMPGHYWRHAPTGYDTLPNWYKEQLDYFTENKKKEGRQEKTISTYKATGANFYRFLESKGIDSFEKITPEVVKQFNIEDKHNSNTGKASTISRLRMFLTHLEIRHIVQDGLHYALPKCQTTGDKRIVKICTEEDREKLHGFCEAPSTPRQIRDAAILRIGITTGMRPADVVGLRWGNVDFQKGCARFVQSKTDVPHVVNLDVATRNALFVYLRDVRPKNLPHDYLFVSLQAPHNPLGSVAGTNAMRYAGVAEGGFRKLRKTHATDMVSNGATVEETARDLGHSNTNTVHKYVVLDEKRMRLCPLSLAETGLTMDRRYTIG